MNTNAETMSNGTSTRITTTSRIKQVIRYQVRNGDDPTATADTQAYLLLERHYIQRFIPLYVLQPPYESTQIQLPFPHFLLNLRIMSSNVEQYLRQQLQQFVLHHIVPPELWNEFIDTLTTNFKTILSGTTRPGLVEVLRVELEIMNEEVFDDRELNSMAEFFAAALSDAKPDEMPASQDSIDALKTMTFQQSRDVTSNAGDGDCAFESSCSICLNEYLNVSIIKWMPCSHVFHSECIEEWLHKKNTCPICRFQMPTSEP